MTIFLIAGMALCLGFLGWAKCRERREQRVAEEDRIKAQGEQANALGVGHRKAVELADLVATTTQATRSEGREGRGVLTRQPTAAQRTDATSAPSGLRQSFRKWSSGSRTHSGNGSGG